MVGSRLNVKDWRAYARIDQNSNSSFQIFFNFTIEAGLRPIVSSPKKRGRESAKTVRS